MKANKIVMMIGHLWQGGGERVCVSLANEFVKKGYVVDLVVLSLRDAIFDKDLNKGVNLINLNVEGNAKSFLSIFVFIAKEKPKTIISFNYHLSFFLSVAKLIFRFKLISRSLNTLSKEVGTRPGFKISIIKKMITFGLSRSNIIIAQSHGMKQDLIAMGIESSRIVIINNPINPAFYSPSIDRGSFLSYGDYILFCGRLSEQKGLHYLLKAMQKIDSEIKLVIVGEGELRDELESLANDLNILSRVIFVGQQNNVKPYYSSAKCTVLSSLYEGFPNVLLESIAVGTPVVSFDCPNGPSEIIQDGVNGYLARYLDSDDLVDKINLIFSNQFEKESLVKTIEKFAPIRIAERYEKVIFSE